MEGHLSQTAIEMISTLEKKIKFYNEKIIDMENIEENENDITVDFSNSCFSTAVSTAVDCYDSSEALYILRSAIDMYKTKVVLFQKRIEDIKNGYE